ncbi:crotonase/enoyl-CoA hydratase family protein [Oricola cellulosilytica]|uniref:Crotonase/enoyl-CoA hydratase family protein n=1 Tax=Oricola cellulosilytica TaxID=1429082 RepID=A0A4R0PH06_9HYPH|nr:crotonase/enoyl-CoA hydratase family protein [Oricola cellulosilytica]TCD14894.1 crotonase/enoyl-CoA hydratase family protein [Oricola cellulosilytica]
MNYRTIALDIDRRGVAAVTLDRPDKHNAMDADMIGELTGAATSLGANTGVRAVVLAAAGKTFCAGGDLNWMKAQAKKDREGKIEEARALANMLTAWHSLPKPVIARVHGPAYGGGVGMISVSDIAVGVEGAKFGLTETRLGLIPATIGPFVVRRLGEGFARQIFFNAKTFDTNFALRSGLLTRVCAPEDLDAAIEEEAAAFLQCAPGAVADAKALCRRLGGEDLGSLVDLTVAALADRWETAEANDGIAAFFAKRSPPWRMD